MHCRSDVASEAWLWHLRGVQIRTAGGTIQIASVANLPSSKAMSGAIVHMAPGSLRQLHWHPEQSEWCKDLSYLPVHHFLAWLQASCTCLSCHDETQLHARVCMI